MATSTTDNLSRLLTQIREAWHERKDVSVVHELASEYPDLADTLYDYLDLLVELDLDDRVPDTRGREEFAATVCAWRDEHFPPSADDCGDPPAGDPAPDEPRPQPVLRLLQDKTGMRAKAVAAQIGMRPAFITKINQHARDLPQSWGRELASRAHDQFGIDEELTLDAHFNGYRTGRLAASRSGVFEGSAPTPEDVLDQCTITDPEERALWLRLAEESD